MMLFLTVCSLIEGTVSVTASLVPAQLVALMLTVYCVLYEAIIDRVVLSVVSGDPDRGSGKMVRV